MALAFFCCFSVTGIRFLGVLFPPRDWAFFTVGLPPCLPAWRTRTGFPRFARVRCGRVGCPLDPGGDGVHTAIEESSAAVCRLSAASPLSSPVLLSAPGSCRNEASTRVHSIHPFGHSPHL